MQVDRTFSDELAGFVQVITASEVQLTSNGHAITAQEMLSDEFYLPLILSMVHAELSALVGSQAADNTFVVTNAPETAASLSALRVDIALDAPASTRVVLVLVLAHVLKRVLGVSESAELFAPGACSGKSVELADIDWSATPSFVARELHRRAKEQ